MFYNLVPPFLVSADGVGLPSRTGRSGLSVREPDVSGGVMLASFSFYGRCLVGNHASS